MAMPPSQGVYNPIKNQWIIAPQNVKIYDGCTFAPVTKESFR